MRWDVGCPTATSDDQVGLRGQQATLPRNLRTVLPALLLAGGMLWGQVEPAATAPDAASAAKATGEKATAEKAAGDLAPQVRKLVRELDAAEKSRRDAAEEQLLKLGPAALSLLPEGDQTSAEVELRLARIRNRLEQTQGEASVQASSITLAGEALSLADAIAGFEKQSGDKLIDFREQFNQQAAEKTLKLDLAKTPFWPALDQMLDQAGMTIYPYSGEAGLALVNRSSNEAPRYKRGSYSGAFRFEAMEITARRDLRSPQPPQLSLQMQVAWEPRLAPIVLLQPADAVLAIDDQGKPLTLSGPESEPEIPINPDASAVDLTVAFNAPERSATRIASLHGKLNAVLPGPITTFRFDKLGPSAKGQKRQGGATVVLEQVRRNNLVWEVRMRLVFDKAGRALESHRTWVLRNEAYLESPDKKTIRYAGLETTRQAENEVGVAYLFDVEGDLKDHTFVYKTPTAIIQVSLEYDLKDIPLP